MAHKQIHMSPGKAGKYNTSGTKKKIFNFFVLILMLCTRCASNHDQCAAGELFNNRIICIEPF